MCAQCNSLGTKTMWCGMALVMLVTHVLPDSYFVWAYPSAVIMVVGCVMHVFDK